MKDDGGIERQLGPSLIAASLLACGVALAYFIWLGEGSPHVLKLALYAVMALAGIVAVLAAALISITRTLHDRITRLERRGEEDRPPAA